MWGMTRVFPTLVVLLVPALAWADAVTVSIINRAELGKGVPHIQVHIHEPIAGFKLELQRSDGKKISEKGGGPPGVTRTLQLQQPEGRFHYTGELSVVYRTSETASMPLDFDAELWGTFRVTLDKDDVDLVKRTARFRASRPVSKAEVQVVLDTGEEVFKGEVPVSGGGSEPVELSWPESKGTVLKVAVRAWDENGFYDGFELFPYEVYVPHDELTFDSGKWEIREDEEPKLDKVLPDLMRQVQRASRWAPIGLYIMGHTDTVGSRDQNRVLSYNRAKAIGAWFRRKGVRIPIYYEGFGEEAPAVQTPDQTDEARNRRVDYILSVEQPRFKNAPFPAKWKKL